MARKHRLGEITGELPGTVTGARRRIGVTGRCHHRLRKERGGPQADRHGFAPVPFRSTCGRPWRQRRQCTNNQAEPLGGGRSIPRPQNDWMQYDT